MSEKNIPAETTQAAAEAATNSPALSKVDVLARIERLLNENTYLQQAIERLTSVDQLPSEAQARALADIVRCRETTNQRAIVFYEKIYDDLRPLEDRRLDALTKLLAAADFETKSDETANSMSEVFDTIRQIMRENFKSN